MSNSKAGQDINPLLIINNLSRTITDNGTSRAIIDKFCFQFHRGQIYNIFGPSGAGKSSLLRLINRLDEPDPGSEILLNNNNVCLGDPCCLRRDIGYLFQEPFLFPGTIAENIRYANEEMTDVDLLKLADRIHMPEKMLSRTVENLSIGERQRVALARLLSMGPEILLLDEPTSALDPTYTEIVEELIKEIVSAQNLTALMVTHQPQQALRMGGIGILLVEGKLIESGEVKQVIDSPESNEGRLYKERKLK